MIGLRRHTVQVVDHDPAWADLAADACRQVREAGGDLIVDIQHVGSTAVPDLRAEYAKLKRDLRARFPDDRESYTDAKRDFIREVLGS